MERCTTQDRGRAPARRSLARRSLWDIAARIDPFMTGAHIGHSTVRDVAGTPS
jgi:hypothetical protein